jgi:hypothetical protein
MPDLQRPSPSVLAAARGLSIDSVTAEVTTELQARGVPLVLLKGPSIARWLYRDGTARHYADTDLLVPPEAEPRAQEVLRAIGFEAEVGVGVPDPGVADMHQWTRAGTHVELHVSLVGIGASPQEVWSALGAQTVEMEVADAQVPVLGLAQRTFHVALHAAQHGAAEAQPMADLERAVDQLPRELWAQAAAIARRLRASAAFAAGLRLSPAGAALADELALPLASTVETVLRAQSSPPLALGFQRLHNAPGARARLRRVLRHVIPSPAFMRWWSPLARRGYGGLALTYLWRPIWVAWHLVPGWRAWRGARRTTVGTGGPRGK